MTLSGPDKSVQHKPHHATDPKPSPRPHILLRRRARQARRLNHGV